MVSKQFVQPGRKACEFDAGTKGQPRACQSPATHSVTALKFSFYACGTHAAALSGSHTVKPLEAPSPFEVVAEGFVSV